MAVQAQPLMVEILSTPPEIAQGRCSDCKFPLGLMFGRAFRGITSDGQFMIQALCLRCAKTEQKAINEGKVQPAPALYRRRRAHILINTGLFAACTSFGYAVAILLGADIPLLPAILLAPLSLLMLPGFYYYGQGVTKSRPMEMDR